MNEPSTETDAGLAPVEPERGAEPRRPIRRTIGIVSVLALVALIVAGLVVRLPYYVLSPGSSRATEPLITVSGATTYENDGTVDFLTVSMRQVTPVEVVASWINPALELRSEEEILGKRTPTENREVDLRMMASSKDSAQYQALTRLGYDIPEHGTGAVIASVLKGGPADGVLVAGDVVVAIDGVPVNFSSQLVQTIGAQPPGAVLSMDVVPFDPTIEGALPARNMKVTLGARADDAQRSYLGITTFTRDLSFDFPVQVSIDSGSVGGPSAGLAFTLGILDVLTPGSISGGLAIATTGTMALDGTVGPVGGVHQKVQAARRHGVELMLVPTSELEEARSVAGDLRIEPVATLNDALAILATVGGGDAVLPPAPSRS